ncbi:glycosyl hydrolase family 28-related protein [Pseudoruegeria sp. SHC-113]|uniref:glycosyl hydrolase family 28-related protein n=1 Tax=Pseudoruegeria sp. SHC-113 TaxID=2855439 RepID=UPI0021BB56B4|nr:glycosyl hydrolase family 28-related protein [Pseudoruegeria sp. SHC-113]MCT8160959.1 right-handed parallel beta-helix repeat-containing protein [Pseudoruegeria sp. SHC-113]
MNKAITEGLVFTPPAFSAGLGVWSKGDGVPGSQTYDGAANAAIAFADADFGDCLELLKTDSTQKLRYMGQVPLPAGCYLEISVRVKAISGTLPSVRIAGWAGNASEGHVSGLVETGPAVALASYGEAVTVRAIVGSGSRGGVDMPWGRSAIYGHFGLDLTGGNGGVVRIEDIRIEDVTRYFLRDMVPVVDVRDYGAVGDGLTDDTAAFEAADTAAAGRTVLIPAGSYAINNHLTLDNPVRFEGTLVMPDDKRLILIKSYDLPTYIDAFGNELAALRKALQALFQFSNHDSLDLGGRRIEIDSPIDMAALAGLSSFASRRVVRNGQFNVQASSNWNDTVVTSQATYSTGQAKKLTGVVNVANIEVGSLVTGAGVGREVYVTSKNVGAQTVTLSQELFDAAGTQNFTFRRFKYVLDFSGFSKLDKFVLDDVEFQCSGAASAIMLAPEGLIFTLRDCFITKPKDRGITSIGGGCQGMTIDRCQFLSNEQDIRVQDRTTIAFNANSNDTKIRDNRVVRFAHFGVLNGTGHMFVGNHWFHGDNEATGVRKAGLVFTALSLKTLITGNYIDNNFVELTNEHDSQPDFSSQFSFGGITFTGNIFTVNDAASWFNWIVITPYGQGHFINGLNVSGNTFRSINGSVERVESVDETYASLDMTKARNVTFAGNTFNNVDTRAINPVTVRHVQNSYAGTWTVSSEGHLPFGGESRGVDSVMADGPIKSGNTTIYSAPYASVGQGANRDQVQLKWQQACDGAMWVTMRMDEPS